MTPRPALLAGIAPRACRKQSDFMKIQKILSQDRRDFVAIYECEHCGATKHGGGYDDDYFHGRVIPAMICAACGKTADESYRPLVTKYAADEVV